MNPSVEVVREVAGSFSELHAGDTRKEEHPESNHSSVESGAN